VARACELIGRPVSRGSSTKKRDDMTKEKGASQAVSALMNHAKQGGAAAITPDGPSGPRMRVKPGSIRIAKGANVPMLPIGISIKGSKYLKTWDRMLLPPLFSRGVIVYGEPIMIMGNDEAAFEAARLALEQSMNQITMRADELCMGEKIMPAEAKPVSSFAPFVLWLRANAGKEDHARTKERLGRPIAPRPNGTLVWLHGTSVGESMVGLSLARELRKLRPDLRFLFTSTTITSAQIITKALINGDIHQYVPIDTASAVKGFLRHFAPDIAIFLEGEIWPNLIRLTKSRGIPMALVNARMTAKTTANWLKFPHTASQLFGSFDYVHPADAKTKTALEALGARNIV
ncbi:MAG: 3-deoxy-D-manno-octulosonic-acid transferase, partial [Hyphomonadaceae bacterium]